MSRLHVLSRITFRLAMAESCMQAVKAAKAAGSQYKRAPKDDVCSEVVPLLGEFK